MIVVYRNTTMLTVTLKSAIDVLRASDRNNMIYYSARDTCIIVTTIIIALQTLTSCGVPDQCNHRLVEVSNASDSTIRDKTAPEYTDARKLIMKALTEYNRGESQLALSYWEEALSLLDTINDTQLEKNECYACIAQVHFDTENYREALAILDLTTGYEDEKAGCYAKWASVLSDKGEHINAIEKYKDALRVYGNREETENERGRCFLNIGHDLYYLGEYTEALYYQNEALDLFVAMQGCEYEQARCHAVIGTTLSRLGKRQEALSRQKKALRLLVYIEGTEIDQATCFSNIGDLQCEMGKYKEGLSTLEHAIDIYKQFPECKYEKAMCCGAIGSAYLELGKYDESVKFQESAIAILKQVNGAKRAQAMCLMNKANALKKMSNYEKALADYEEAVTVLEKMEGTENEVAMCRLNIANTLCSIGRNGEGIGMILLALGHFTSQGLHYEAAGCYQSLGVEYDEIGMYEQAVVFHEKAIEIQKDVAGTERERACCYKNLGSTLISLGETKLAINTINKAMELFIGIEGTEREQAGCNNLIGITENELGNYQKGIQNIQKALDIFSVIKDAEDDKAMCYVNIGYALKSMGEYKKARQMYVAALNIFNNNNYSQAYVGRCWSGIGDTLVKTNRFDEAIEAYKIARETADLFGCASNGLARAYRSRGKSGDRQKAAIFYYETILNGEFSRDRLSVFKHRMAVVEDQYAPCRELGNMLVEMAFDDIIVEDKGMLYCSTIKDKKSQMLETAFHYIDRGKGKSLEKEMKEQDTIRRVVVDSFIVERKRDLSLKISRLYRKKEELLIESKKQRDIIAGNIIKMEHERNMIEFEIKESINDLYEYVEIRKPFEVAQNIGKETAILQYSLSSTGNILIILTKENISAYSLNNEQNSEAGSDTPDMDQLLGAVKNNNDKVVVEEMINHVLKMTIHEKGSEEKVNKILVKLGNILLPECVMNDINKRGIKHLIIIPDGAMYYLPFAMLRAPDENGSGYDYLVSKYAISYLPSLSALDTTRQRTKGGYEKNGAKRGQILAFANANYNNNNIVDKDDMITRHKAMRKQYYNERGMVFHKLPYTEKEALDVAGMFGKYEHHRKEVEEVGEESVVFTNDGASEKQVKKLMSTKNRKNAVKKWRYILFSTHGFVDEESGMMSGIVLSSPKIGNTEDGFLQGIEIVNLDLECELVMLSACQTSLGKYRKGEGLVGLSEAFLIAGTESVCGSLWSVPSGPTCQLVTEFFKEMKFGKYNKAEALRRAQLKVINEGTNPIGNSTNYSSPFCWAAFILMGEYR